ncbi:transcriptional regulator [plant metagenome]|uniref:Transcriptional regulator n=2 Tax=plant metagenome TaxID=1297885 RepID=A0A484TSL1_9ZZZZ
MKTFGERLRHARHLRGMTQRELALASKVSQSAIGNYESDLRNSSRALLRLAQALAVSPAWLENGQGAMETTATAAGYPMPRHNTPTLRDELTAEQPARPAEWLFDARDHERYLQLHPENRRFLRQAMRALLDSLHAEQGTPVPTRKSRRPT